MGLEDFRISLDCGQFGLSDGFISSSIMSEILRNLVGTKRFDSHNSIPIGATIGFDIVRFK